MNNDWAKDQLHRIQSADWTTMPEVLEEPPSYTDESERVAKILGDLASMAKDEVQM